MRGSRNELSIDDALWAAIAALNALSHWPPRLLPRWRFSAIAIFDAASLREQTSLPVMARNGLRLSDCMTRSTRLHVFVQHHQHPGQKQKHRGNNGMPPKHEGNPKECNDESKQCHPAIPK